MLLKKKNLVDELLRERSREESEDAMLKAVKAILRADEDQRVAIKQRLSDEDNKVASNTFNINLLETEKIFNISQIKAVCIDYRLRFLDSSLFKAPIPEEAISKIKCLEKNHNTTLTGYMIMAPSKHFHLKNYDDPLLFAPIGNNYYYLVHKWGNDLNPYRKLLVRPLRDMGSFVLLLLAMTALITAVASGIEVKGVAKDTFLLLMFLFIFKSVCGVALYYFFWKGKNFNAAIWDSEYYNR